MAADELPRKGQDDVGQHATAVWTKAFREILDAVPGEHSSREGLMDTPTRAAKAMAYFTQGYQQTAKEVVGSAIFQSDSNEMVLVQDIDVYSLCEHHVIPFFGKVHVAFLPQNGRVVGLSKIPRLVDVFAQRLQIQERLTTEIGKALQVTLDPRGVAVIMECRHMCMEMRGVQRKGASTRTQFRCGLFDDASKCYWREFEMAVFRSATTFNREDRAGNPFFASPTGPQRSLSTVPTTVTCSSPTVNDATEIGSENNLHDVTDTFTEAENYRLYQSCATSEFTVMAKIIVDSIHGPSLGKKKRLSVLDIGAGNGRLIECLVSKLVQKDLPCVDTYRAFEQNKSLCDELKEVVSDLGFCNESCRVVRNETFSTETSIERAGGLADIVLLSHCLYYTLSKEALVHHALKFVAPGGIMFIFHHWNPSDTLDKLSSSLYSAKVLHHMHVFETRLNVKHLSHNDRVRVSRYSKTSVSNQSDCIAVTHGCLAIESFSDHKKAVRSRKVSYEARRKSPVSILTPGTVVGIQSCLQAASLGVLNNCSQVSVVGGGHSSQCHADNAIAIDMHQWDEVIVDTSTRTVRVGGGATVGAITTECEKHGLVVPLGDRPSVGMGLVLQGGLNHLMRTYGLACDNILSVSYVSPTGELLVASSMEELFPFRGAGPSFGVVHEVTLKAHKLDCILVQSTDYLLVHPGNESEVLSRYSDIATKLPDSLCLDGFIYWSSHDQLAFSTSSFDAKKQEGQSDLRPIADVDLPTDSYSRKIQEEPSWFKPSELFDRELYMTERFHPFQATKPGQAPPEKLRSLKRCLLFPPFHAEMESAFWNIYRSAPTKWTYVHFLHGGGAAGAVNHPSESSAFGCRDWAFAAVITVRYPDGDKTLETASNGWLTMAVDKLMPFAVGAYGADLGPADIPLAQCAFGNNSRLLAKLKRMRDPLNVLSCCCPLLPQDNGAVLHDLSCCNGTGVVIIFCGRRFTGKDWLAQVVHQVLAGFLGNGSKVSIARISDTTKRAYAADNPGVEAERLIHDREYKESHRRSLSKFYESKKVNNVAFDAQCFVEEIENSQADVLLLTGMRDGLSCARRLSGRPVVMVKVDASIEAKQLRGWVSDRSVDETPNECSSDHQTLSFWDCIYSNDTKSTVETATEWVSKELVPAVLKCCVRLLPETPKPGVVFKDLGGILEQPFGLRLTCTLMGKLLATCRDQTKIDVVAVPEATGYLFAGPVAMQLQAPLVAFRKPGKLPGDVSFVQYEGSNIGMLRTDGVEQASLEVAKGSILRGQQVLVIDDCLASGSTAEAIVRLVRQKGAFVKRLICVMEMADLNGRCVLEKLGVEVTSLMTFDGK